MIVHQRDRMHSVAFQSCSSSYSKLSRHKQSCKFCNGLALLLPIWLSDPNYALSANGKAKESHIRYNINSMQPEENYKSMQCSPYRHYQRIHSPTGSTERHTKISQIARCTLRWSWAGTDVMQARFWQKLTRHRSIRASWRARKLLKRQWKTVSSHHSHQNCRSLIPTTHSPAQAGILLLAATLGAAQCQLCYTKKNYRLT